MKKKLYLSALLCSALIAPNAFAQCPAVAPPPLAAPTCTGAAVTGSYSGHASGTYSSTGSVILSSSIINQTGGTLEICSGTMSIAGTTWSVGGTSPTNIVVASGATLNISGSNFYIFSNANITNYGTINFSGTNVTFDAAAMNSAIVNQGTITSNSAYNIYGTDNGIINNGTMTGSTVSYSNGNDYFCLGTKSTLSVNDLFNAGTNHAFFTASGPGCVKLGSYTPGGAGNVISNTNRVKVCTPSATSPTATAAGSAVVNYSCFNCIDVPLPVTLKSFIAKSTDDVVKISFATADEKNIASFDIEKSTDASNFVKMGRIAAKNMADANYSLTDNTPAEGTNYYRLRVNQTAGSSAVSGIASASILKKSMNDFNVYPNPAQDKLNISGLNEAAEVIITDLMGRRQVAKTYGKNEGQSLDISSLVPGIYLIRVQTATTTKTMQFTKAGR